MNLLVQEGMFVKPQGWHVDSGARNRKRIAQATEPFIFFLFRIGSRGLNSCDLRELETVASSMMKLP